MSSVSSTIGDFHPERSIFQLLIATTACPRFIIVFLSWMKNMEISKPAANTHAMLGLFRTFSCGGFVFITSTDNGIIHDMFMLIYILGNVIYMPLGSYLTQNSFIRNTRRWLSLYFILSLLPMFYIYFLHKNRRIAGAYTYYAFFEWGLIIA